MQKCKRLILPSSGGLGYLDSKQWRINQYLDGLTLRVIFTHVRFTYWTYGYTFKLTSLRHTTKQQYDLFLHNY